MDRASLPQRLFLGLALSACCGLVGAGPVLAQEEQSEPAKRQVLVTKLYEAYKKQNWKDVILHFGELSKLPNSKIDHHFLYLKALAHFNLKENALASDALEQLLQEHDDHVEGLFLLATIKAQDKSPAERERAKDYLLQAARSGRYVLRDINSGDGQKVFKDLLNDPSFILKVMNASNEFTVTATNLRNPFDSPIRKIVVKEGTPEGVQPPTTDTGQVPERLRRLEEQVEQLFRDINTLAEKRQVDELIGKFQDLRNLMAEYGADGSDMVRKKMEKWKQRLASYGEVILSIQLQIYIQEGNQHLRAMAESIKQDQYDAALERFERIKELRDQMLNEEREVFHRNADALFLRGKALADRAARLKRISEFKLVVQGIVVAPPNEEQVKDSAIINDRIYYEGDAVIDDQTEEEIPDLFVVEIVRQTVRFRYQDTEFVRELQQTKLQAGQGTAKAGKGAKGK
ncbi:MAG: tetratricopeptide repeat protein [Planctomycetota bacterium]